MLQTGSRFLQQFYGTFTPGYCLLIVLFRNDCDFPDLLNHLLIIDRHIFALLFIDALEITLC